MPTTVTVSGIKAGFSWDMQKTTTFGANTVNSGSFSYASSFTSGTGAGAANHIYVTQATIAASGTLSIDLSNTGTLDPLDAAVSFANIKMIYIEVVEDPDAVATGSSISVGGDTNAVSTIFGDASDKIKIQQGGCFQLSTPTSSGYAVTASTGDIIKIVNNDSTAAVIVRVAVVGEKA